MSWIRALREQPSQAPPWPFSLWLNNPAIPNARRSQSAVSTAGPLTGFPFLAGTLVLFNFFPLCLLDACRLVGPQNICIYSNSCFSSIASIVPECFRCLLLSACAAAKEPQFLVWWGWGTEQEQGNVPCAPRIWGHSEMPEEPLSPNTVVLLGDRMCGRDRVRSLRILLWFPGRK